MKFTHKTALITALFTILPTVQAAPLEVSANVALTSNYIFRGLVQTDEGPAIQGGFDVSHDSGLSAGIWGSNVKFLEDASVDPHDRADHEIDLYIGFSNELNNGFSYGIQGTYFLYPGADSNLNYDFAEVNISLGYSLPMGTEFGLSYDYSPEFFGESGEAHNYTFNIGQSLNNGLGFGVYVGQQTIDINANYGVDDYIYYGASVSYGISDFELSLNISDTDLDNADEQVFFMLSKSF